LVALMLANYMRTFYQFLIWGFRFCIQEEQ
jgi:hypothetical protein